ncbi:MAG: HAD family hydrolase [Calditrichaeota bacterium]|nr:MAG: HAD family hydrolase [Calditrichota bacterium]MBL1204980.1 HAD family hydrolase [Calditrichota bacterium]NOG44810.1 HAD-IC family P-type ATPase [Calditrichota bacterium]
MHETSIDKKQLCYHCGEECRETKISFDDKLFCCNGCKVVYELLSENNLCTYYNLENSPGINAATPFFKEKFSFLDDNAVINQLLEFSESETSKVTFFIPSIHCSSCIWLLEKIYKLNPAVKSSRVNFVKKEVSLTYNNANISLREIAELLTSLGYEPQINLIDLEQKKQETSNKKLYIKIGIAGFAFGNSMMFSFPEYLDAWQALTSDFKLVFGTLNILLAIPVLFYSASDYFISSFKGLRKKMLNIDVPISIGILALVARSLFEIISGNGPGYFDSFTGLVFFLLLGRLFQDKTYATLSFERNYKSYFPVSVTLLEAGENRVIPVSKLNIGDTILLRNQELIPADALLLSETASIDYSFVTGESELVDKNQNEMLYAGGRLSGSTIEVKIVKKVSQSYLTKLWNNDIFKEEGQAKLSSLSDKIAQNFTFAVLAIAIISGTYWAMVDWRMTINVVSAILIIACPCALALSIPFSFGNALRVFGKNEFFLKNIRTIEQIKSISHIVFDKTGTLTWQKKPEISFSKKLSLPDEELIKSLTNNSVHPISRFIYNFLKAGKILPANDFVEISGKGMLAQINGHDVRIGSAQWIGVPQLQNIEFSGSTAHVLIDGDYKGYFSIKNSYRPGLSNVLQKLAKNFKIALISGDNAREKNFLTGLFEKFKIKGEIRFNQTPYDKQNFILNLQKAGDRTLMIGDGLNDAGALKQSDLGISISEDVNTFSPACDAILNANHFEKLPVFINYAKSSYNTVITSFILSFLYNSVGLYFAVTGVLSPLIAAILMPLSSISVVVFATLSTRINAKRLGL